MGLPINTTPQNYLTKKLPSTKTIGVCGWKVKEEKELLFTLEVEENKENKITHIINLLKQCVDDKDKFDTVSENDLIKIALESRILAKGDVIEYNYECPHCANKFFDEVNLIKEQYTKPFDVSPLILSENLIITFKDLDWKKTETLYKESNSNTKFTYKHLMNSIDSITIDGTKYTEFTAEEVEAFIDGFDPLVMKKIYTGFESRLSECGLKREIKCIKCKEKIDINFGDLLSFLVF